MTTTPLDPRSRVLDAAVDAVAARVRAEVDLLVAAAEWAVLHPATEATGFAGFGVEDLFVEQLTPLAGPGAPLVAEFAPAELAAVLGWSTETVKQLMADALELRCRLPRVWDDVLALRLAPSLARFVAEQTHDLDRSTVHQVDLLLAGTAKLTRTTIRRMVDEQRLYADPDRAVEDERQALAARRVMLSPGRTPATVEVEMSLDAADAHAFDHTVSTLAGALRRLGETDDHDVLRARAVGILADPQAALGLLGAHELPPARATAARPAAARVEVALRLDLDTLADLALEGVIAPVETHVTGLTQGVATSELIAAWVQGWLGPGTKIVVRPYADLSDPSTIRPVDGHDPTEPMAWYVRTRDPSCVFPGCTRASRRCDLDHIDPYHDPDHGGPPGQTHPDNLAPLCRHHHRAKTHGRWSYSRLPDGSYQWTTPTGRTIDVVPARRSGRRAATT